MSASWDGELPTGGSLPVAGKYSVLGGRHGCPRELSISWRRQNNCRRNRKVPEIGLWRQCSSLTSVERCMVVVKLIFLHSLYTCNSQCFSFKIIFILFNLLLSSLLPFIFSGCSLREATIRMTPLCGFASL